MQPDLLDRSSAPRASPASWAPRTPGKRLAWGLLALFMIAMGVGHFVLTKWFVMAMSPYLPWHRELVLVSGGRALGRGICRNGNEVHGRKDDSGFRFVGAADSRRPTAAAAVIWGLRSRS